MNLTRKENSQFLLVRHFQPGGDFVCCIGADLANHFQLSMDYLMGKTDTPGFDSKTPTVFASQITEAGIATIHTYAALSAPNKKRVEEYVQMLSEWEKAYLPKGRRKKMNKNGNLSK